MICYIFGAGEESPCSITLEQDDFVIAADGGLDYAKKYNVPVNLVMGDMDSVSQNSLENCGEETEVYPPEKDDTDLLIAIKKGMNLGYKQFEIYGALGGRLDHTIGNIQILRFLTKEGCRCAFHGKSSAGEENAESGIFLTAVMNSEMNFEKRESGTISVFSLSETCEGVTIEGLKYEIKEATMTDTYPLGVSNEFVGKPARISVENGILAVIAEEE